MLKQVVDELKLLAIDTLNNCTFEKKYHISVVRKI